MNNTNKHYVMNRKVSRVPFSQILEAIAKGVEARLVCSSLIKLVTLETINIAQKLHIPEEEIQVWYSSRCLRVKLFEESPFIQDMRELNKYFPELTGFSDKERKIY